MPRITRINLLAASVALFAATGPAFAAGVHGGGGTGHVSGGGGAQPAAGQNFGASNVGRSASRPPAYFSPNAGVMRPVGPGGPAQRPPRLTAAGQWSPAFPARPGPAYRAYGSLNNPAVVATVHFGTAYRPGGYFFPYTFAAFDGFSGAVAGDPFGVSGGDFEGVGFSGSYAGGSGPVVAPPNFVPVPAAPALDRSVIPPAAEDPAPAPATSPR